jgi:hypothetical protein
VACNCIYQMTEIKVLLNLKLCFYEWRREGGCKMVTKSIVGSLVSNFYGKLLTCIPEVLGSVPPSLLSERTVWFRDLTKFQFSIVTETETDFLRLIIHNHPANSGLL